MNVKNPAKHGSRSRVLTPGELSAVWNALPGEVTQMRWSQIDMDAKTWLIPAELPKNGREHLLPLSSAVIDILTSPPRLDDELLFPAKGNSSAVISEFSRAKIRIDQASGIIGWTLHDLRRTTATYLGKLGTPPRMIERILNHVSGTFAGVAGVCNRYPYLDEMRDALEDWGKYVGTLGAH